MTITNPELASPPTIDSAAKRNGAIAMVTTLFFIWGFAASLNDTLVPYLKSLFDLSYARVMLIQCAFFSSYFVFAIPAGKVIELWGYKRTMIAGLLTAAAGALAFLPAANVPAFWLFLSALTLLAGGLTGLQVAANPFIAAMGPARTASSRLNLAQGFTSLGQTLALPFGSWLLLNGAGKGTSGLGIAGAALRLHDKKQASLVNAPYSLLALTFTLLAIAMALSNLPAPEGIEARDTAKYLPKSISALLRQRHFVLGFLGLFLYMGAEVSIGSFLVSYLTQPEIGGMTQKTAAFYVSFYWGGAMAGRFAGARLLRGFRSGAVLLVAAVAAGGLVVCSILSAGQAAAWTMLLVGVFNSVMVANIFTLAIAGLGPLTGKASGILVSSAVGAAIVPVVQGALADHIGIHRAFVLSALCYLYIAFYGLIGSKSATPLLIPRGPRDKEPQYL